MKLNLTSFTILSSALVLSACVNQRPNMTAVPRTLDEYQQTQIATPIHIPEPAPTEPGSLWRQGSRQFFKDSRAHDVGDIVTIIVSEVSEAEVEAETETKRTTTQESGITNLLNAGSLLVNRGIALGDGGLVDANSQRNYKGEGDTDRKDKLSARITAIVTQVLPNGYLYVQGKREVVVNYELKELGIAGIVRPEDISSENTVSSEKIAEARVFYAGRGIVDHSQAPQYGVTFMDKVLPF